MEGDVLDFAAWFVRKAIYKHCALLSDDETLRGRHGKDVPYLCKRESRAMLQALIDQAMQLC